MINNEYLLYFWDTLLFLISCVEYCYTVSSQRDKFTLDDISALWETNSITSTKIDPSLNVCLELILVV